MILIASDFLLAWKGTALTGKVIADGESTRLEVVMLWLKSTKRLMS